MCIPWRRTVSCDGSKLETKENTVKQALSFLNTFSLPIAVPRKGFCIWFRSSSGIYSVELSSFFYIGVKREAQGGCLGGGWSSQIIALLE